MPNANTFPFEEIDVKYKGGTLVQLRGSDLDAALQYCGSPGFIPLMAKWKEFQEKWHAPKFPNWDVHFVTGSQEGCFNIFELLINSGDAVMVQTPTFTGTLRAMLPLQPDFLEIIQDSDGVIPEEIDKVCKKMLEDNQPMPKFLYVNPTGANPTGTVLPEERKKHIYKLAQKYNFLILEDDAYYFLHFMKNQPVSFLSLDTDGRVIRFDSFSKIFSAGLRLGVVTAHKDILEKLSYHVQCSTIHASTLSQVLIYNIIVLWNEEKLKEHFKSIQDFYRRRRDIMTNLLEKYLDGLAEWSVPKAGFFVWLKIKDVDDIYDLVMQKCIDQNIFFLPGHAFYKNSNKQCQYIRVSYSYASEEDIEKALKILGNVVKNEIQKKKKIDAL
ncbi:kynurenine/alpha-aminoadipate aminotransferase, mitochondrial-like isoform X2 [Belonocnema kinseyi]|nr:kynurenine/alpha-aminoadipate aminotransferase, mitochondrial-like isoform X2 [Belonocnema kinseyi]XP_033217727.1 kynurenine/alpha-aminoadipate aminotransferase, mitochondrial-like isoform X2 [Belonocnema kinseyi]